MPVVVDQALQRILGDTLAVRLDYYGEYVDMARFAEPGYLLALRQFLKSKYEGHRFDVVIATSDAMLELVKDYREEPFAGVPVVFHATSQAKPGPRSTGVISTIDLTRTITMALELQPETRRVFVVCGSSVWDRYYEDMARAQLGRFEGRLDVTYLSGLPMPELLERVAALPPDSIVYPLSITEDRSGHRFLPLDAHDRIAAAANAPVYAWVTLTAGRAGVVGGSMASVDVIAERLAELALRVLGGEEPDEIPVTPVDVYVDELDWRQLRRWGISEARVPAGTTVRHREPSAWERYRSYILGTVLLVSLQTALIVGLVIQRARRRGVEVALRASHRENQDLAGRLITAQEEERARIARELHDDVNQQLAGLSILLSNLRPRLRAGASDDADAALTTLQGRAAAVADTVRGLSHELHSGALQHAGLTAALREHCAEFARHHGIDVALRAGDDVGPVHPAVALCLYRVAQEALTNTGRHARARSALVSLTRTADAIELEVRDDGVGFDPGRRDGGGLGLRSIGERVRLVGGRFHLESEPERGTRVRVRVPAPVAAAAGVVGAR